MNYNNQTTKSFSYKDIKGVAYTTVPQNRYEYGVCLNLIPSYVSKNLLPRINEMLQQAKDRGYQSLNKLAQQKYETAQQRGYTTTLLSAKNKYLREAKGILLLTTNLYNVEQILTIAWYAQTPVTIFNPNMQPDVLNFRGTYNLNEYYALRKELIAKYNYEQSFQELRDECTLLLNGYQTPWLDTPDLGTLYRHAFNNNMTDFLTYIRSITDSILSEGQWDVELTASHVQREAQSVYHTLNDKGLRTTGCNEHFKAFHNYDTLPVDELNLFMTLTYYKSVGMKPLQTVAFDNELGDYRPVTPDELEEDCTVYHGDDCYTTTPLYVEQSTVLNKDGRYDMPLRTIKK